MMARRVYLLLALAVGLTAVLLSGCGMLRSSTPDGDLAVYTEGLRAGQALKPGEAIAFPRYNISVLVDPTERVYTGTLEAFIPLHNTQPLRDLYFRLYPNLRHYGGELKIRGARINGMTVNYSYDAQNTVLHLVSPKQLGAGASVQVWLSFVGRAPQRADDFYTLFGRSQGILNLASFYPILAGRRGDTWALEVVGPPGDVGFHDAALYLLEVTAPADQVVVASGKPLTRTVQENGWVTTRYALGPARECALLLSPEFQVAETEAYGVQVRSYFLPQDITAGQLALGYAATALKIYNDQFGPYPYQTLTIVEAPIMSYGLEFAGLNLLGSQAYRRDMDRLEGLVAHEIAHQWWYNLVGNDQVRSPWLDEGLAEFSKYIYFLARYGFPAADDLRRTEWEAPVARLRARGSDPPIGRPAAEYKRDEYETVIYGKAALFFLALRGELGPRGFQSLLRRYSEDYRWRIATPADFLAVVKDSSGRDFDAFFAAWVGN